MPLDVLTVEDIRWLRLVESFGAVVFYQPEYCELQQERMPAFPLLFHYHDELGEVLDVVLEKQVSTLDFYRDASLPMLQNPTDLVSAEYNGPIVRADPETAREVIRRFRSSVDAHCLSQGVVTEFVRFHPFLSAIDHVREIEECICVSEVIYIDLSKGYEAARHGYRKGHRAAATKAARSGIEIRFVDPNPENIGKLTALWNDTMRRRNAIAERVRSHAFFDRLFRSLGKNAVLVEAQHGEECAVSALFLLGDTQLWYMYAGTNPDLKSSEGGVLLLDRVAHWAAESGYSTLVLGGGSSRDDSIHSFKRGFSHLARPVFQLRKVHNAAALKLLLEAKISYDAKVARATQLNYFPPYWLD
jgi:Acetyltransferase (GNAT) domain